MIPIKRIERLGRRFLVWLISFFFGVGRRPVALPRAPRILVVRLDERVGNLIMLTPLLSSLRRRFPEAQIELLASAALAALVHGHPALDTFLPFRKRALFAADGPIRTSFALRRRRYDLAMDAANPTDPSATQVILVRLSGAKHTVGPDQSDFGRLFSAPASIDGAGPHEIDLRLALLAPVPGEARVRQVSIPAPRPAPGSPVAQLLGSLASTPFAIVNVGARLFEKSLGADQYAQLARLARDEGLRPLFTYGPTERPLADAARAQVDESLLAPPTDLPNLGVLMQAARAVITCDTGPMHVAVALGTPTIGLFVSTEPERYGYAEAPHARLDLRRGLGSAQIDAVRAWLSRSSQ